MRANIYVVLSDFQAKIARSLIDGASSAEECLLVTPDVLRNRYFPEIDVRHVSIPYSASSPSITRIFLRAGEEKKALNEVRVFAAKFDCLNFYVAHFESFFANWVYCRYAGWEGVSINLIQDGVLSYYECRPSKYKMLAKRLISLIWLEKFKAVMPEITLIASDHIDSNYVAFGVEHTLVPDKSVQVNVDEKKRKTVGAVSIIIGQEPIVDKIGRVGYLRALYTMIEAARINSDKILYVSHPRADNKFKNEVIDFLNRFLVDVISIDISVEAYVSECPEIRYIYSHSSSSLILIKVGLQEQVECFYAIDDTSGFSSEMETLFRSVGVLRL